MCKHEFEYCPNCNAVHCKKCGQVWGGASPVQPDTVPVSPTMPYQPWQPIWIAATWAPTWPVITGNNAGDYGP